MSREIKFRAWIPERKLMGLVTEMRLRNDDYLPTKVEIEYHYEVGENSYGLNKIQQQFTSTTDFELMQYTGLKDKNGVEIYEGDILGLVHKKHGLQNTKTVVWDEMNACFDWEDANSDSWPDGFTGFYDDYSVIGNIYENPELLEQPNEPR